MNDQTDTADRGDVATSTRALVAELEAAWSDYNADGFITRTGERWEIAAYSATDAVR